MEDGAWFPALVGALGVVVGSLVTGGIQIATILMTRRHERKDARRQERKLLYIEALWNVRQLPRNFRAGVLEEEEARANGKWDEFVPRDNGELLDAVARTTFELRLLGRKKIAKEVDKYRKRFVDWVMSLDPDNPPPFSAFAALEGELDGLEDEIVELMRKDLA